LKDRKLSEIGELRAIKGLLKILEPVALRDPCLPLDDDVQAVDDCKIAVKIDGYSEGSSRYPWEDPEDWGWRAVTGPVSDLSAKGYSAVGIVYSLGAPRDEGFRKIARVVEGIRGALEQYGVPFLGGDLNSSDGSMWIDVAAVGVLSAPRPVPRRGAKPGDSVYTTIKNGYGKPGLLYKVYLERSWNAISRRMLRFRPVAVTEFPKIISSLHITSAIDSSDGLAKSLKLMAEGGNVSIILKRVPITGWMRRTLSRYGVDIESSVLFGGEEYEVIFTTDEEESRVREICSSIGIRCLKIGEVVEGDGKLIYRGKEVAGGGWDQFKGKEQ